MQSTPSQESLDSSAICSLLDSLSDDNSTVSLDVSKINIQPTQSSSSSTQTLSICHSPKKQVCRRQLEQGSFCGFQSTGFVGFVGGFKSKPIQIRQSNIKRAQHFLQSSPLPLHNNIKQHFYQQTQSQQRRSSVFSKNNNKNSKDSKNDYTPPPKEEGQDFTLGFKNVGTGLQVKIKKENEERVKKLFGEESKMKIKSARKSTKAKLQSKERQLNYEKTVNDNQKYKNKTSKLSYKKEKETIQKMLNNPSHNYRSLRLQQVKQMNLGQFGRYWQEYSFEPIIHSSEQCRMPMCYFCRVYGKGVQIVDRQSIEKELRKLLGRIPQDFNSLWQIVVFKLERYGHCDRSIVNKCMNANNILIQLFNKLRSRDKGYNGYFIDIYTNKNAKIGGKCVNLIVVDTYKNEKNDTFYVRMTDGWTILYAIITHKNRLYEYMHKFVVGLKINIVDWIVYPICNILQYHPYQHNIDLPCIQIYYNCSNIIGSSQKLGRPSFQFYRPIQKCKVNGGNIAVVQGIIIRMFNYKSNNNNISNSNNMYMVEILTTENKSHIMKIGLPAQTSIVQLFELYGCYRFYKIKKTEKYLQFISSKYEEIRDPLRMEKVRRELRSRLLNCYEGRHEQALQDCDKIDIITDKSSFTVNSKIVQIQQKIQQTCLLQQYKVVFNGKGYTLTKGQVGSKTKKISKVYSQIQYHNI